MKKKMSNVNIFVIYVLRRWYCTPSPEGILLLSMYWDFFFFDRRAQLTFSLLVVYFITCCLVANTRLVIH